MSNKDFGISKTEAVGEAIGEAIEEKEKKKINIKHLIGNIVGIALCAVLLPIVVINMTLVAKSYIYPDNVPTFAGVAPLIVTSGSMHPAILLDDLAFTKEVGFDKLREDDIVAFLTPSGETIITHRIVRFETNEAGEKVLVTKGDANNAEDDRRVTQAQVIGRYFFRIKGAGVWALFMKEPVGMLLFVGAPVLLFVAYEVIRKLIYNKKHKKNELSDKQRIAALEAQLAQAEEPGES
ncbi:MAG: signal peptidase I [Oscillospiraceae bacterium]|nr:signal peptidase I [Oscillospiraceae bacterium]